MTPWTRHSLAIATALLLGACSGSETHRLDDATAHDGLATDHGRADVPADSVAGPDTEISDGQGRDSAVNPQADSGPGDVGPDGDAVESTTPDVTQTPDTAPDLPRTPDSTADLAAPDLPSLDLASTPDLTADAAQPLDIPVDTSPDAGTDTTPPYVCSRANIGSLPHGSWSYELIPSVVKNDGSEPLVVEVRPNDPAVTSVSLRGVSFAFGGKDVEFNDAGKGADRMAGDGVFTAGPLAYHPPRGGGSTHYGNDPASPKGLLIENLGRIDAHVQGVHEPRQFLIAPEVGIVDASFSPPPMTDAGGGVTKMPHLLEVCGESWATQLGLRALPRSDSLKRLTTRAYAAAGDSYDFLLLFSTYHVEAHQRVARGNFTAGRHYRLRNTISGIGIGTFDNGAPYGSASELKSINLLDTMERGMVSQNALHEMLHQWGASLNIAGLTDGTSHWNPHSSVGSLLGGFAWELQPDGSYLRLCTPGRNGGQEASPLDLYLMGLIPAEDLPTFQVATNEPIVRCDAEPPKPYLEIPPADITDRYGVRSPGPNAAQRSFRLAFIAEAMGRSLTQSERIFYNTFAEHFTRAVPSADPNPEVTNRTWAPITRFFGHGVTFRSDIQ